MCVSTDRTYRDCETTQWCDDDLSLVRMSHHFVAS